MLLLAGTSGFSYSQWRGSFYEERLPESRMLSAYAERLPTVEINNTFYRMPQPSVLESWANKTGPGFCFAVKAPRRITHLAKLERTQNAVTEFCSLAKLLGEKLGPLLFQLPPTLKKDTILLSEFASQLPPGLEVALEFRHPSWFTDDVYSELSTHGIALCAAELEPEEKGGAPYVRTAGFSYVRLRRAEYDRGSLAQTLARIQALEVERTYVYFKHELSGPRYALDLLELATGRAKPARTKKKNPTG